MAVQMLDNVVTYIDGHDFTGDTNKAMIKTDIDALDKTTFGSAGWKEFIAGLRATGFDLEGLWQSGTTDAVDVESFPNLGTIDCVHTLAPTGVAGDAAYMFKGGKFNYVPNTAEVGQLAAFTLSSKGTDRVGQVRGSLLVAKQTVSTTGVKGSSLQLGAVSASQSVYATFHVFSAGTTITAILQSDDNAGFSTPTTRYTFGPITARGGTWAVPVAGAITDDYWRINVSTVTGSFVIAAAVGIR